MCGRFFGSVLANPNWTLQAIRTHRSFKSNFLWVVTHTFQTRWWPIIWFVCVCARVCDRMTFSWSTMTKGLVVTNWATPGLLLSGTEHRWAPLSLSISLSLSFPFFLCSLPPSLCPILPLFLSFLYPHTHADRTSALQWPTHTHRNVLSRVLGHSQKYRNKKCPKKNSHAFAMTACSEMKKDPQLSYSVYHSLPAWHHLQCTASHDKTQVATFRNCFVLNNSDLLSSVSAVNSASLPFPCSVCSRRFLVKQTVVDASIHTDICCPVGQTESWTEQATKLAS